jgi:ribonuclease HI
MHYLYTDGGARGNPGPAASAFFLFTEDMQLVDCNGIYLGETTNNVAEYSGLIAGLKSAAKLGIKELECRLDSELVVKQIGGEYKVKEPQMQKLHAQVCTLMPEFTQVKFKHVPRAENKFADKLVNTVLDARS